MILSNLKYTSQNKSFKTSKVLKKIKKVDRICSQKIRQHFNLNDFENKSFYNMFFHRFRTRNEMALILNIKFKDKNDLYNHLEVINQIILKNFKFFQNTIDDARDKYIFFSRHRSEPQTMNDKRIKMILNDDYYIIFYIKNNIVIPRVIKCCFLNSNINNQLKTVLFNTKNIYYDDNVFRYACDMLELNYIINNYDEFISSLENIKMEPFMEFIKISVNESRIFQEKKLINKIKKSKIIVI